MQVHELSAQECTDVLSRTQIGRLGCARNDQPYIVPIHFSYDSDHRCLYAFSTIGQKIDWMRENPKVCVEVEEIMGENRWTTVLAFGRYHEIQRAPEDAEIRKRAEQLLQQRNDWWFPAAARVGAQQRDHVVVYAIEIDRMSGRRAAR